MAFEKGHKAYTNKASAKTRPEHTIRAKDGTLLVCKLTRKSAILAFCAECLGWEDHPSTCTAPLCPLYPFRGKTLRTQKGNTNKEYT